MCPICNVKLVRYPGCKLVCLKCGYREDCSDLTLMFDPSFRVGDLILSVTLSSDDGYVYISYYDKLEEADIVIWRKQAAFIYPEFGGLEAYRTEIENALKARILFVYEYAESLRRWVIELKGAIESNEPD